MSIRKIFQARKKRKPEPGEWTTLRHNGPWFDSFEEKVEKEEMREIYQRVPEAYRNDTFWSNCPFTERELQTPSTPRPRQGLTAEPLKHSVCEIDGEEVAVSSWKMEPPTVFLGRGDHPLRGGFRRRISPEDVTLNLDEEAQIPKLPRGRSWGAVVHQHSSPWLWSWTDPLLQKTKYVYPHPSSTTHVSREIEKFETARELKEIIQELRAEYLRVLRHWTSNSSENIELALILFLIDQLGIRIGNPGSQTGASTLLRENVLLRPERRRVRIRFIGKDSIQYDQELHVEPFVLYSFQKIRPEQDSSPYFPHTSSREVNAYLQSINPRLKAKVFRTYNASEIFERGLREGSRSGSSEGELIRCFRQVNMEVARFCNHRKIGVLTRMKETYSPRTSITNYVDPRIIYAWSKRFSVPIERVYSKILIQRFEWASTVDKDFVW